MNTISKRARYAFHGLTYLAAVSKGNPVPFDEILGYLRAYSKSLTLSSSYIAKMFQEVSRAGFMSAVSGPRGGYQLARGAETIHLAEIIEAVDGPLLTECCLLSVGGCPRHLDCGVGGVVRDAEMALYRVFQRETLASLAAKMDFPDAETIQAHRHGPLRKGRSKAD